jgi:hypothetical protein
MTFEPKKPSARTSSAFDKEAARNHLLIFVGAVAESIDTRFGKDQPAARCAYVVDLDVNTVAQDALMFGTAVVPALTDDGDEIVVGRLDKATGNSGNDFWLLYDPDEADLERARVWLNANASRSPATQRIFIDTSF